MIFRYNIEEEITVKEYLIKINNETISIKEIETYEIKDLDRPKLLAIGPDIICEAGF